MLGALYAEHARTGDPIMRALGYEFPGDPVAAPVDDCFLLGPDILVAPVLEPGATDRVVYLPAGCSWLPAGGGDAIPGGRWIQVAVGRATIVAFSRSPAASELLSGLEPLRIVDTVDQGR
jgi:alpha-D-xyloside xylohydrolase